jgi:hypothetical protein
MIVALCAYVMIQANHKPPASVLPRPEMTHMSNIGIGHVLLEESVRVRQGYDHRENPTHMSVLTSWFYSGCYFGLARENTAWTYLRDATTQAQLLGMHNEETYKHDPLDTSRKRVLYWLLFIAERCARNFIFIYQLFRALTNCLVGLMLCTSTARFHCIRPYIHHLWTKCRLTSPLQLGSNL